MTEKKLYAKDNARRSSVRDKATSLANDLAGLARAWTAFDYGKFSMQDLGDALESQGRTVPAPATGGCKSCAGMLQFSSGQTYLEEFLLDRVGDNASVGGLKLSRNKLRDLIELPAAEKVEAFDKYLRWVKSTQDFLPFVAFDEDSQTATILEEAIEQHCSRYDLYLRPEKDTLLEQAQQLLDDFYALNGELAGSNGQGPLRLELTSSLPFGPFTTFNGKIIIRTQWIVDSLCVPVPA